MQNNIIKIQKKLESIYPPIKTSLKYKSIFQLLIATILSAQCTDKIVNKTTKKLFKKYPNVSDLANADIRNVKNIIKSTGYYSLKANRIKNTSKRLKNNYNSKVPDNMEDLLTLDGVGRKTANIVLSVGFNKNVGIAVDTHVIRLSNRLKLTKNTNPEKIEIDLIKILPKELWNKFSILLILHGRNICQAKKPDCSNCILNDLCPYAKEILKN